VVLTAIKQKQLNMSMLQLLQKVVKLQQMSMPLIHMLKLPSIMAM